MDYWLFLTSDWSLASSVNNTVQGGLPLHTKKMCDRDCFSQMGDVLFASLRVSKLQKLEKGSILWVYNGVHLMMEVAPPSIKAWPLCSSQWLKGHKVWLKPNALWAYKHARWKPCCCGIFCSRFHLILSPLKIILEMVFWTNLMLDLICTWLEKTRRFCRQVNKKISSCFWTASTCVQRSSLEWCSRLTYMETVDWIHVTGHNRPCPILWNLE